MGVRRIAGALLVLALGASACGARSGLTSGYELPAPPEEDAAASVAEGGAGEDATLRDTGPTPIDAEPIDVTLSDQTAEDVRADQIDVGAADAPKEASDEGGDASCTSPDVSTRYDSTWMFGHGCRADWDLSGNVTFSQSTLAGGTVSFTGFEGTFTTTTGPAGAFFAASDGIDLYNAQGTRTNSVPLGGNASTSQAATFVGEPGGTGFYLLTNAAATGETTTAGIFWTFLPCGQPVPTAPPSLVAGTDLFTESLATIRHANGVDRWVLSAAATGMAVVPLTASGFGSATITPWGGAFPTSLGAMQRTFITFARDRRTFAMTAENVGLLIGQFDDATGAVSALTPLPIPSLFTLYSAAFSPDGTKLYVSAWAGQYYQVDLTAFAAGADGGLADGGDAGGVVATLGAAGGAVRLAIDDRIYVATEGSSTLAIVTNPNAPAAQLAIDSVALPAGCTSTYGFPGLGDL